MSQNAEVDDVRHPRGQQAAPGAAVAQDKAQARATARARVEALLSQAKSMADAGDVDGAVAYLMGLLDQEPPSATLSTRLVWFLMRERRFGDTRAALERLQAMAERLPGLRPELAVLQLEYRLLTQQLEGIEAQLATAQAQHPGHETLRALEVMALLMRGQHDRAVALMRAEPGIGEGGLARAIRLFHLLDQSAKIALSDCVLALPGFTSAEQVRKMALALLHGDRAMDALDFIERAMAAHVEAPGPRLHLVAARAAALAEQPESAAVHLAHALGQAFPDLGVDILETLRMLLRGIASKRRLQLTLSAYNPTLTPDIDSGLMQRRIQDYLAVPAEARYADKDFLRNFFRFALACNEVQQLDLLRAELPAIPETIIFTPGDWRRLMRFPGLLDDAETRDVISRRMFRTMDPLSQDGLLYRLMLLPPGEGFEAAAADSLEHLESGRRSWDLRFFLAEEWPYLRGQIQSPSIIRGLERQVAHVFDRSHEATNLATVTAQRHLIETILDGLPAPPPARVSIITPCHRLADLENLRRCVGWQSWAELELVVVANGPLHGSPAVAEMLAGLPAVTILHSDRRDLGYFLNLAMDASSGDFVFRFDSDDLYFEDYTANVVRLMTAYGADLAGKSSLFFYSERLGRTFFSQKGNYLVTDSEAIHGYSGSTICMTRDVARRFRFAEDVKLGEDAMFYDHARQHGCRFLTLDPFDHVVIRRAGKGEHTWRTSDRLVSHMEMLPLGDAAAVGHAATGSRPHARIGFLYR